MGRDRVGPPEVAGEHAIITGATGFIGAACVREFIARGWRVTALGHERGNGPAGGSNRANGHARRGDSQARALHAAGRLESVRGHPRLDLASCSIADRDALVQVLADCVARAGGCRALVHCAGRATDVGWDRRFRAANLIGVQNVCHAVNHLKIGRLVHVSTTDVYGVRDFFGADEATPHENNRRNPYPKYKILAEQHIRAHLPRDRYVTLRPAFVWGPGDATVLPRAIGFLRASPVILHFGRWRGRNRWPLAYVGNVARVACAAATSDTALGEAYNVVDPEPITMDEYYRMILDLFLPGQQRKRSLTVPFCLAWPVAALSTVLSDLLDRPRPIYDPSLYGLRHVTHSQDFSSAKAARLLESCGWTFLDRAAALEALRTWDRSGTCRAKG